MIFMLMVFPPLVVLPVHAMVMAGCISTRVYWLRKHINWTVVFPFMGGSVVGGSLATQFLLSIPEHLLQVALGTMASVFCWIPKGGITLNIPFRLPLLGAFVSFVSMFGPGAGMLFGSFLAQQNMNRFATIGTQSACFLSNSILKAGLFSLMGFSFGQYAPFIAVMIAAGVAGILVGSYMLTKVRDETFKYLFKFVISALCIHLILQGLEIV